MTSLRRTWQESCFLLPRMNTPKPPKLVAVMPIYNEAANIEAVLREWFNCFDAVCPNFQIIALNDGSRDETQAVLDGLTAWYGPRLRVIQKSNSGHGRTCRQGYELALETGAEWVFQLDSDGQCDPFYFPELWARREGRDCVFAYRRTRGDGFGRVLVSTACRALLWLVTGAHLRDPNVPYRLMRSGALRAALRRVPADFDIQNVAVTYALKQQPALEWGWLPIHFRARQGGENSINFPKIVRMGMNMLRDFSASPRMKLLILGAGPTGLGAAWRLTETGHAAGSFSKPTITPADWPPPSATTTDFSGTSAGTSSSPTTNISTGSCTRCCRRNNG